jgi:hypothetical protein
MSQRVPTPPSVVAPPPTPTGIRVSADGSPIANSPWSLMRLLAILVAIAQANGDSDDEEAA